jgi:energy-coupling factor transporter ATP-binding protein EcfA2
VVLAKWLATKPPLLILDTPTVGVDIGATDGIYAIVRRLAEQGLGVNMISDEIPEVYCHSHRVLVMRDRRIGGDTGLQPFPRPNFRRPSIPSLLLADTSGTAAFSRTRAFYREIGYLEEARIRDFWADGDDKVVFSKRLT